MNFKSKFLALIIIFSSIYACNKTKNNIVRKDFEKYYSVYNLQGSFILFDKNANTLYEYNSSQLDSGFLPASTFKILNSLIALETGIAPDENFTLKWDSVERWNPNWNSDQDMKTAFKNSTVWYYQELARRIGEARMKFYMSQANYGNFEIMGEIDKFWLNGGLRISPRQQIRFLQKLNEEKLPFQQCNMQIVKKIMISQDSSGIVIHSKTGMTQQNGKDIGWFVGWLEKAGNTYYFANCIQCEDSTNQNFIPARKEIAFQILKELDVIR